MLKVLGFHSILKRLEQICRFNLNSKRYPDCMTGYLEGICNIQ